MKDGDTIVISSFPTDKTIRLAEIDCPEWHQEYGQQAKRFTSRFLGRTVSYEIIDRDTHNREVAKVYAGNLYLSEELVKNGYAWVYRRYSHNKELINQERTARRQKLGLWNGENIINPYQYRINND